MVEDSMTAEIAGGQWHVVASGETLSWIANRYKVDWRELAQYNMIKNPNLIQVGELIKIPRGDIPQEAEPVEKMQAADGQDIQEQPDNAPELTPIVGASVATEAQAIAYLKRRAPDWVAMAGLYYNIAPRYGIRADIALCQAMKETGAFRFDGIVKPWQNNFAGIAATGRACDGTTPLRGADPQKVSFRKGVHGAIFKTKEVGVEAQIQHLHAYASATPLPPGTPLYSPRFNLVNRASAKYVEHLGAGENPTGVGWAFPGLTYGRSIISDFLEPLLAQEVPVQPIPEQTPVSTPIPAPEATIECANCEKLGLLVRDQAEEIAKYTAVVKEVKKVVSKV